MCSVLSCGIEYCLEWWVLRRVCSDFTISEFTILNILLPGFSCFWMLEYHFCPVGFASQHSPPKSWFIEYCLHKIHCHGLLQLLGFTAPSSVTLLPGCFIIVLALLAFCMFLIFWHVESWREAIIGSFLSGVLGYNFFGSWYLCTGFCLLFVFSACIYLRLSIAASDLVICVLNVVGDMWDTCHSCKFPLKNAVVMLHERDANSVSLSQSFSCHFL
jgi:hypothetical protein